MEKRPFPVGIILLAAGNSSRLGRPKQLLVFNGRPLLRRLTEVALEADCGPVVVVLGAFAPEITPVLHDLPITTVINTAWEEGMASSVRCGLAALEAAHPDISGCIFLVCDQPHVSAPLLTSMLHARAGAQDASMVACAYAGVAGIPALFDRKWFGDLGRLQGGEGARSLIRRHADQVALVPFPEGETDLDTPEDYSLFISTHSI